jgi:hypothetical protein
MGAIPSDRCHGTMPKLLGQKNVSGVPAILSLNGALDLALSAEAHLGRLALPNQFVLSCCKLSF